jgi:hypothetical protein
MDQRNVETFGIVQVDGFVANQSKVQVAGSWTVGIKWSSIVPALARDGASAENDTGASGQIGLDYPAEFIKSSRISIKNEPDDPFTHFFIGRSFGILIVVFHNSLLAPTSALGADRFFIRDFFAFCEEVPEIQ